MQRQDELRTSCSGAQRMSHRGEHGLRGLGIGGEKDAWPGRRAGVNAGVAHDLAVSRVDGCLNSWVRAEPIEQIAPWLKGQIHGPFFMLPQFSEA